MRNPYDRAFKLLAETEPRALLHLFAGIPIDADVEVRELERELGPPTVYLDHLYEVRSPNGAVRYIHLEFQNQPGSGMPERLLRYATYRFLCDSTAPLDSFLILPVEHAAAARVPEHAEARAGQLRIEFRYTIVRLWELDPEILFALQRPGMLPLVALARASDRDLERAADEIVRVQSKELAADLAGVFATLGGLRYDRNRLIDLLEKRMIKEFLTPELMRQSSFLKPLIEVWEKESRERGEAEGRALGLASGLASGLESGLASGLAKGLATGLAKGQDEGKLAEARRSVRHILAKRFPSVPIPASLEALTDLEQLHDLADEALTAADEEQARAALAAL